MAVTVQATLFDSDAETEVAPEPAPLPAEPWLVDELVREYGVPRDEADGYSMRQSFAVRARMEKARLRRDDGKPSKAADIADLPAPLAEPRSLPPRPPQLVREVGALQLEAILAEFAAERASEDELMRFVRGSCYLCTAAELVRVAKGLIPLLRETR